MYSLSITLQVSLRGLGSMSCTVHYTVLYRSYKFRASALTLRLCFCCFKDNQFHGYNTGSIQFAA